VTSVVQEQDTIVALATAIGRGAIALVRLSGPEAFAIARKHVQSWPTEPRIAHLGGELEDFTDTAAVLAIAELVICVDTSVAHLAGALGRPAFVLLPFQPDWRWTLDGETSPWYPAMRLFRQPSPGDWASVIARVRDELALLD